MNPTRFVKLAVTGFAIGMTLTGGHAGPTTQSESVSEARQMKIAAKAASKATKAIAANDFLAGIVSAETAVTYQPRDPAYRMLLGQAYLGAGRFTAAETSFADTLTLSPDNGRAALNLALVEIAQGKKNAALSTLADYHDKIAAADHGLALALAGDPDGGVRTLEAVIRAGNADAKVRQNLALAYALAGKWANARVMAVQDLAPADADARIVEWSGFVRPKSSYDQVASLLGVTPVQDTGQPERLALNAFPQPDASALAVPVATPAPVEAMAAPAAVAVVATPVAIASAAPLAPAVTMGERREIVQSIPASIKPAPIIRAAATAARQAIVPAIKPAPQIAGALIAPKPARGVEAGKFVVQLGAFENAAVSRDAWKRVAPRYGLTGYDPANSSARVHGANFVRLSVGGFETRGQANTICTRIRNSGGACFVRGNFGDAPAQWVQRGMPKAVRVASR